MNYNPDTFDTPDVPVSPLSIKTSLNWSPRIAAHIMLWFGSPSHLPVGYMSSDPATIAAQVSLLKQWGVDFAMLDWYGTLANPQAAAALAWKAECEKQGLHFAICMDNGIFQSWNMPKGMDVTTWATQMMQYAHANFLSSPMYEKTSDGRHLMINFNWQGVTGLDAAKVLAPYTDVAMLWEHSGGVSKPSSAGAFAWVGVSATDTQTAVETYTANFLSSTAKAFAGNGKLLIMGSLCSGFDDHNRRGGDPTKSCWDATQPYRFADQKNGQTMLNVIAEYNASTFKPQYMQLVTFNDYEEDTALERGIDSLLTASLTEANGVLTVSLNGNLATVDHVDIYASNAPGAIAKLVSTQPADTSITFDLGTLNPANNQLFVCRAIAVGKPLFQIKLSNTVSTTAVLVPAQTAVVKIPPVSVSVPEQTVSLQTNMTSTSVPVSGTANGLTVSGAVTVPIPPTVDVILPSQTVTVSITQPITVTITTQTLWS